MLYECSCGFTSITATAFYRHLAQFKDAPGQHQLVQAKLSDLPLSSQPTSRPVAPPPPPVAAAPTAVRAAGLQSLQDAALYSPTAPPECARISSFAPNLQTIPPQPSARLGSFIGSAAPATSSVNDAVQGYGQGLQDVLEFEMHQQLETITKQQEAHDKSKADTETLEINCRQNGRAEGRQEQLAPAGSAAMQDMFVQAGSAVGSLLLYGLNPLRLFGLSEPRGTPDQTQSTSHQAAATAAAAAAVPLPSTSTADSEANAGLAIASFDAVLLWRDPWRSFRVFGMLLYIGICCQQVSSGALPILPSTALLAAALLYLTQNAIRASFRPESHTSQAPSAAAASNVALSTSASSATPLASPEELRLYLAAQSALEATARLLIPPLAAGVVLLQRALSGRRLVTAAITWTCLWSAMFLGELRLMGQLQFAMLLYVAVFTIPALYVRSREGLDVLVEDLVRLLLRLLLCSSRLALCGSALSALLMIACTSGWSPVLRASAAAAAALAVLLWQARPALQRDTANNPSPGALQIDVKPKTQ